MPVHGATASLVIAGVSLDGYFRQVDRAAERDLLEATMFGHAEHRFAPGRTTGSVTLAGLFEPTADALLEPFVNGVGPGEDPFTFAPLGLAAGQRTLFGLVREASYKTGAKADDMVEATAEFKESTTATVSVRDLVKVGGFHSGQSSGPLVSVAAGGAITLDRGVGAATALQKLMLQVHSSVMPTTGYMLATIFHSADNVSFVGLTSVGWGVAPAGDARYLSSPGGLVGLTTPQTINRYLRVNYSTVGAAPGYPIQTRFDAAVFS